MEVLLLGIYSFFVWLIFIKFKWLPWNILLPGHRRHHPDRRHGGADPVAQRLRAVVERLRVFKYTVPIVSQVRGRVIEVPVEEGNRLVKKGDVLFRSTRRRTSSRSTAGGAARGAEGGAEQLRAQAAEAGASAAPAAIRVAARPGAQARRRSTASSSPTGAGNRFDLEQAEADAREPRGRSSAQARARSAGAGCRRRRPARRSTASSRRSRRSARSSRTRNGTSTRPPRARPANAMSSTCSFGPAASSRRCRSPR